MFSKLYHFVLLALKAYKIAILYSLAGYFVALEDAKREYQPLVREANSLHM